MPIYWGKQIFAHGRFPKVGKKQKTQERERKKERLNDGNNNGQATHSTRMAHASRLGQFDLNLYLCIETALGRWPS